jgi:isocitrate/isopropylmalate dehydrogenase
VLFTPIIKTGFQSFNLKIRKELDLFANVVRARPRPAPPPRPARSGANTMVPTLASFSLCLCLPLALFLRVRVWQVICKSMPGYPTRHKDVDLAIIRENTEGEYSGLEHEVRCHARAHRGDCRCADHTRPWLAVLSPPAPACATISRYLCVSVSVDAVVLLSVCGRWRLASLRA